jgi:hypothetical protein
MKPIKLLKTRAGPCFSLGFPQPFTLQEKRNARCGAIGWQISGEVGHPDGAAA